MAKGGQPKTSLSSKRLKLSRLRPHRLRPQELRLSKLRSHRLSLCGLRLSMSKAEGEECEGGFKEINFFSMSGKNV